MKRFMMYLWSLSVMVAMTALLPACNDDDSPTQEIVEDNAIAGQDVGFKSMTLKIPRLGFLDALFTRVNCHIYLRGEDWVTYPINTYLSATEDTLTIEAEDAILSEMPHQKYKLSYVTFPKRQMTSRGEEVGTDTLKIGAKLSATDPNDIHFTSTFDVENNRIGSGTKNNPIIINTGQKLYDEIGAPLTKGDDLTGRCFELNGNIALNLIDLMIDTGWVPLGNHSITGDFTPFNGELCGDGYFIESIVGCGSTGAGGLFYMLGPEAYIHDVAFQSINLDGGAYVGTVSSRSSEGARIENIKLNGTVKGRSYVGALIGEGSVQARNIISGMNVEGNNEKGSYVGGLIGMAGTNARFTNCLVKSVNVTAVNVTNVGGVSGYGGYLDSCYVSGIVQGHENVGGMIGYMPEENSALKSSCQVAATINGGKAEWWDVFLLTPRLATVPLTVSGENYVGGYIGYAHLSGSNCEGKFVFEYSSATQPSIKGKSRVGGFAGACSLLENVQNLSFESKAHIRGTEYVGGFAGSMGTAGTQNDIAIVIDGQVEGDGAGSWIGGIAGYLNDYSASNPQTLWHNKWPVKAPEASVVGGIVGYVNGRCQLPKIKNDGLVSGNRKVGGLIGKVNCNSDKYCVEFLGGGNYGSPGSSTTVSGTEIVGGMIGELGRGEITGTFPDIYANVHGKNIVGGLIGNISTESYYPGTITGVLPYMVAEVHGTSNIGGIVGQIIQDDLRGDYLPFGNGISPRGDIKVINDGGGENTGGIIGYVYMGTSEFHVDEPKIWITGSRSSSQLKGEVRSSSSCVGGVIGRMENNTCKELHIEGWYNNMKVVCTLSSAECDNVVAYGGIVGGRIDEGYSIYIDNCANFGAVGSGAVTSSGGIAGYVKENVYIGECYNTGTIDGFYYLGGILGRVAKGTSISNCYNTGNVLKKANNANHYVGGILGIKGSIDDNGKDDVSIENCYNVGTSGYGIASGVNKNKHKKKYKYTNCYYVETACESDYKDGKKKSADEMRKKSTYSGFDNGAWGFAEGVHAPYLIRTNAVPQQPLKK